VKRRILSEEVDGGDVSGKFEMGYLPIGYSPPNNYISAAPSSTSGSTLHSYA